MDRRDFLTVSSTGLLLRSAGCLGNLDGGNERSYEEVNLNCEGLEFGQRSLPLRIGYSVTGRTAIRVSAIDSVPDNVVVIDALEEDLDEHEHLGEVLRAAGCSDERVEERSEYPIAEYFLPHDQAMAVRELLGDSRKTDDGWYVGYDADVYRISLVAGEA